MNANATPCEAAKQNEILPHEIVVGQTDPITWRMHVCNASGRVVLGIADGLGHRRVLADQSVPPPNPLPAVVVPPALPHGRYVLIWDFLLPSGPDWQTVVEVEVRGAVVFRQFKSARSALPATRGFLYIGVV